MPNEEDDGREEGTRGEVEYLPPTFCCCGETPGQLAGARYGDCWLQELLAGELEFEPPLVLVPPAERPGTLLEVEEAEREDPMDMSDPRRSSRAFDTGFDESNDLQSGRVADGRTDNDRDRWLPPALIMSEEVEMAEGGDRAERLNAGPPTASNRVWMPSRCIGRPRLYAAALPASWLGKAAVPADELPGGGRK